MGEFGSPQLDIIQQAVETITNTGIVELSAKLENVAWWTKYDMVEECLYNQSATDAVYRSIFSISGAGYIKEVSFNTNGGASSHLYYQIIVDGVIVMEARCNLGSKANGLLMAEFLDIVSTSVQYIGRSALNGAIEPQPVSTEVELPYYDVTTLNKSVYKVLQQPLFFNTSFEVKIKNTNNTWGMMFRGGVL